MKPSSPIDIVDAAYRVGPSRDAWLRGVLDAAAPVMDSPVGLLGYFIGPSGPILEGAVTTNTSGYSGEDAIRLLLDTPPPVVRQITVGMARMVSTSSEVVARGEVRADEFEEFRLRMEAMRLRTRSPGRGKPIREFLGVLALDAEGCGVVLSGAYDRELTLDRALRRRWTLIAVHIAAAARLRRGFEAARGPAMSGDVVLTPTGRVEHAEGDAKQRAALDALRARAVTIDRARSRRGRSDPDASLEAWQGLVSGRWSLVDRFESDGRRYVVAHGNDPKTARILALTPREQQVVSHLILGHTSKLTAYTLGVSPAAVSAALKSSMEKLGVRSPAQLLHRLSGVTGGR